MDGVRLGDLDSLGHHLTRWLRPRCGCGRSASLPIQVLARVYGPATRLVMIVARFRCRGCGARPVSCDLVDRGDEGASGVPESPMPGGRDGS